MARNNDYMSAITTNIHYLEKWNKEEKIFSDLDILKAAKWNYRNFGYGYVSLDKYVEYLRFKKSIRLYNVDVKLWYSIIKQVFKRDGFRCFYCGKIGGKLEADHKIPISKGGLNTLENLVTACRRCNRQKKDKSVEEFMLWKEVRNG